MRVLRINPAHVPAASVSKVCSVVWEGGLIVYPTETVYGIGADIFNEEAVMRIYSLKGREPGKPLSIALADVSGISEYAQVESAAQREFIENNLPGPCTVVLKKRDSVPDWISKGTVGIRVPAPSGIRAIIRECGPITATSANPSGLPAPASVQGIDPGIKGSVDLVLDGGETRYKRPSRVFDLTKMEVLRA